MADPTRSRPPENPLFAALKPVASLRLTVGLFAASMVLVFFGTLAQMNNGIWKVVDEYFWSWGVWIPLDLVGKFAQVFFDWIGYPRGTSVPYSFPFPAGKAIGLAMLVNLLAAHLTRFRLAWKRSGILVIHAGMILLFVGEAITRMYQVEQRMVIQEGGVSNYAEDSRNYELAVVDEADSATVVPHKLLERGGTISHADLPFDVAVLEYMPNSDPRRVGPQDADKNPATAGLGLQFVAERRAEVSGVSTDQRIDIPAAYVKLIDKATQQPISTHLVFVSPSGIPLPADEVTVGGKKYGVGLRFTRYYKPFTMKLLQFRFDRYVGTNKPKNYSSDIKLTDPDRGLERTHHIAMNDPLSYRGETFYQSGFGPDEKSTILQVVHNPGEVIPYVSCVMVGGGMVLHFGIMLVAFLRKPRQVKLAAGKSTTTATAGLTRWLPLGIIAVAALYLLSVAGRMSPPTAPYDLKTLAAIPVVDGGRTKPLDTVARVSLKAISARETFKDLNGDTQPAIRWYLDVATFGMPDRDEEGNPKRGPDGKILLDRPVHKYKVFKIENDKVLELLGLKPRSGFLYSFAEFADKIPDLSQRASEAAGRPQDKRDLFDVKVMEVAERVKLYVELANLQAPLVVPADAERTNWLSLPDARDRYKKEAMAALRSDQRFAGANPDTMTREQMDSLMEAFQTGYAKQLAARPAAVLWTGLLRAYREEKPGDFNKALADHAGRFGEMFGDTAKAERETGYNAFAPFWECMMLYFFAFLLCLGQLLVAGVTQSAEKPAAEALRRSAFGLLALTAVMHFAALIARMYFQDRWLVFVTNLYSSAVFIGFGCVLLGLLLERVYPIGIGNLVASVLGFLTTVVSHQLGASGDSLEMMQAVLDTNFWLATHVTCVTLGYTATFVAGALGIAYVLLGLFTPMLRGGTNKTLSDMMYSVVAFATLLSFVGTVLGGIWADYSWGRFWGWDPKENGAGLIVIWNCLILHARWAGIVKARGVAVLTILGNMVTVWSWFGTNQLGIGLHAYGFDNTIAQQCAMVWIIHLLFVGLGLLPLGVWGSFRKPAA